MWKVWMHAVHVTAANCMPPSSMLQWCIPPPIPNTILAWLAWVSFHSWVTGKTTQTKQMGIGWAGPDAHGEQG
jgi:hypothetical protein